MGDKYIIDIRDIKVEAYNRIVEAYESNNPQPIFRIIETTETVLDILDQHRATEEE